MTGGMPDEAKAMDDWTLTWWVWLILGMLLLAVELQASTEFYLLFFAVGAFVVSLLAALGFAVEGSTQWLLFAVISLVALPLFRRRLLERLRLKGMPPEVETLVGEIAIPLQDIAGDSTGRVELRGTVWNARNATGRLLASGQRCSVVRVEGLMLWVQEESRGTSVP